MKFASVIVGAALSWLVLTAPANASFVANTDGSAFAALVSVPAGTTSAILGPIAPVSISCNLRSASASNSVLTLNLAPFVTSSGTAVDTVTTHHDATSASVQSTSTIQGASLLSGLVTATLIKAESNSQGTSGGASSDASGSTFVGLVVAGVPILVNPAPNTTLKLPGIGFITLNEQIPLHGVTTGLVVNMIHIRVTLVNTLGLKVGTNIIVAHASSSLTKLVAPILVSASSYGLFARGFAGKSTAQSGPWAPAGIPCTGGSSTDQLLSVSTPIGSTGLMLDTAMGSVTPPTAQAGAESKTNGTNLLGGLITADVIDATAAASFNGSVFSRSASTKLLKLRVNGIAVSATPPANTIINIAGLGFVIINEQTGSTTATSTTQNVNAIHLFVTTANKFGLPVGAFIIVGHAHADVATFF